MRPRIATGHCLTQARRPMCHWHRFANVFAIIFATVLPTNAADDWFLEQVAPVFQRRCLSCHHDGESKGDFSLSNSKGLVESGYIDTDDVDASYLLELVTPHDGKAEMPKDAAPLTTDEIASLREWIASGAKWPDGFSVEPLVITDLDWWSLRPIAKPSVSGDAAQINDHLVDALIDMKLVEKGLSPVEQADSRILIRRLTYDLTGLPPTPSEVDSFVRASQDDAEQAWRDSVDRLLSSPAFGEKWGQHWLDVARYAETHGYDKDKPRNNAWPYRDYVIRSLNSDKPYSRFVQEQIAGDALFPGDPDGIVGLGFLAAGPWDFIGHWEVGEGKLDGRIAKHLDRDEMISAVFNVFMSTTVQCAQCHHHKFDPIRMEDYYRLHAVFAAVDRADRVYDGLPPEQQERKNVVLSEINRLKLEQDSLTTKINREVAAKASGIDRRIAELSEKYGTGSELKPQYGYHSQVAKHADEPKWVQLDFGQPRNIGEVRIIPAYDQFNGIGAGFGFPVRYRVEAADDEDFQDRVRLLFDASDQDRANPRTQTVVINGDGQPARFLRVTATKLRERKNDFIFALGEIEISGEDDAENFALHATVTAKDSIEAGVRWGKANLVDGIFYRELTNHAALEELKELRARREAIERTIRPAGVDERLQAIKEQLDRLTNELKEFPSGQMVYAAAAHFSSGGRFTATGGKPRPIHLLTRGDLRSPAERMTPGTLPLWKDAPATFSVYNSDSPSKDGQTADSALTWNEAEARAELARYITREDNPLVWRSIVNRLWTWTFGSPLVESPNDFGRGGMLPTHAQLLDELAARLRDDPRHSLKSIVRLLVTSKAYRRSSRIEPEMAKLDAGNTFLWRANRRRLTAEEFRDSMLLSAGLLNRTIGGESFHDFVIEKPQHSPHYEYHLHDPADLKSHRRSVYRFVVRSQPQPLLTTLDCADPSISVSRRDESTTALQALAAWNNRLVEFTSSKLGARLEQVSASQAEQVATACRLVLGRDPSLQEETVLMEHLSEYGAASLARVIFNMNAFVYLD
jgi:mono/diheme cytochrome c family protein